MSIPEPSSTAGSGEAGNAFRVIIVGAGIAGLTAAYRLTGKSASAERPLSVTLCEVGNRVGGAIASCMIDDLLVELGADSFVTDKPQGLQLAADLGISHRLVPTNEKFRRTMVARDNRLHEVPAGFFMMAPTQLLPLMRSDLFTWSGKARMCRELFVPKAPPDADETLREFVERRLGKEAFDRVAQPLVGGVYTCDPDKLSVKAALPRFVAYEQNYGSVIKGLRAGKAPGAKSPASGARYGMFVTFDDGMQVLINSLENALPPGCLRLDTYVQSLNYDRANSQWQLHTGGNQTLTADAVILAVPAHQAARMLAAAAADLSTELKRIEFASSAVLNLVYRCEDLQGRLNGFGFVVPRSEKKSILACSYTSMKFPKRMTANQAVLRAFVGGALQPDIYALSDEEIECLVWQDLYTYLGIRPIPQITVISRFPNAMPQYNVGHTRLIENIEASVTKLPGLALAGNSYHGVGIPDCIATADQAVATVRQHLDVARIRTASEA